MKNLINSNLYSYLEYLGKNTELKKTQDNLYLNTKVSHPFFNAIYVNDVNELKLPSKSTRLILNDQLNFDNTKSNLEKLGFFYAEDTIGMAMYLDQLDVDEISEFSFKEVKTDVELKEWLIPLMISYKIPNELKEYTYNYYKDLTIDSKLKHYILKVENNVVAACSLFFTKECAGLYNVCTIPKYRKKGLGTYITKKALKEAKVLGYNISILQASVMGTHIYENIGFRKYNKQNIFIYLKK